MITSRVLVANVVCSPLCRLSRTSSVALIVLTVLSIPTSIFTLNKESVDEAASEAVFVSLSSIPVKEIDADADAVAFLVT